MNKEERTLDNSLNILFKGEDDDIQYLLSHIRQLEANINDPEWCCTEHKAKLVAHIKKLEEAIEKHKNRMLETFPNLVTYANDLNQELYKVLRNKLRIGHWQYADEDEWIDDKLEYKKKEYNPECEENKEEEEDI